MSQQKIAQINTEYPKSERVEEGVEDEKLRKHQFLSGTKGRGNARIGVGE